jgi:hypothetical protein
MRIQFLLLAVCFLVLLNCSTVKSNQVLIMVDFSSSTKEFRELYKDELVKIIQKLPGNTHLIIGKIASNTESDFTPICNETFTKSDLFTKEVIGSGKKIEKEQKRIIQSITGRIDQEFKDTNLSKTTNILSSLYVMKDIFPAKPGAKRTLIIMSDMLQEDQLFNLDTDSFNTSDIEPTLTKIQQQRILPNLQNVNIIVIGASAKNDRLYSTIKDFWSRVFNLCNAKLLAYGHSLTDSSILEH